MKYERIWGNKFVTLNAESIDDMIKILEASLNELKEMREDGVVLEKGIGEDYARLVTDDPEVAEKYNFQQKDN